MDILTLYTFMSPMLIGAGLLAIFRLIVLSVQNKDRSGAFIILLGLTVLLPMWNSYCYRVLERQDLLVGWPLTNTFWLIGPALYFFLVERLSTPKYRLAHLVHFVPYMTHVVIDHQKWLDGYTLFFYSCSVWLVVSSFYLAKMVAVVRSVKKRKHISAEHISILAKWGIGLIIGFAYFILLDMYYTVKILANWKVAHESVQAFEFFRGVYFISLLIFFQFVRVHKKLNEVKDDIKFAEKISTSLRLEADTSEQIAKELEFKTDTHKLYLDPDIDLRKLSKEIGVSPHDLSDTLNATLKTNFYSYINNKRINYACELLVADSSKSVIDVAIESGFNSKGAFYSAFKKTRGMTPSNYRQQEAVNV